MSWWWFLRFDHISYCSLPQMRKALFLSPLMLIFLAACSPQSSYTLNPQPDISTKPNEIPESQKENYMRIIGDLRWDKLTSIKDWKTRFPGCFPQAKEQEGTVMAIGTKDFYSFRTGEELYKWRFSTNPKCMFSVGGLQFSIQGILLEKDPTGRRPFRSTMLLISLPREDQERTFDATIKGKYSGTMGNAVCSKYSCFYPNHTIVPTPHATSLLDSVKVDSSAF